MTTFTLTLDDEQMQLALSALRNWDGWDGREGTGSITDDEDDTRWELVGHLAGLVAERRQFCSH